MIAIMLSHFEDPFYVKKIHYFTLQNRFGVLELPYFLKEVLLMQNRAPWRVL